MSGEQITTLAELEALPVGSAVLSATEVVYQRFSDGLWYRPARRSDTHPDNIALPARVLDRTDAPSPAEVAEGIAQAIEGEDMISTRDLEPYWEGWHDAITKAARIATEYGQGGAS